MEDYWIAEILRAVREGNELVLRLEWSERIDAENPVIELRLKGTFADEAISQLNANLFAELEIYFTSDDSGKYLEIAFENPGHPDLRLAYSECVSGEMAYTVEELKLKLERSYELHKAQANIDWQEIKRLRQLIQRLETSLLREIDRLKRKSEFFADTERATQFSEKRECYQKVYDWMKTFEKDSKSAT